MQLDERRAGLVLFAVAALLWLPGAALAQDAGKATRLLKKANEACAGTEPAAALPVYEEALKAKALPQIHLAYGDCLRQLGKFDQALEQYNESMKKAKGKKAREQAEALIKLTEEERQAAAAAAPAASGPSEQAPAVEQPPDLKARPVVTTAPPRPTRRRLPPLYFWAGVGVTAALLATGTACGVVALLKSSRFKDETTPYAELQDLKDTGQAMKLTSTITFAVGGATAIATTVLFFFTRFKAAEAVSAAPVPGGAVVVMGGRF